MCGIDPPDSVVPRILRQTADNRRRIMENPSRTRYALDSAYPHRRIFAMSNTATPSTAQMSYMPRLWSIRSTARLPPFRIGTLSLLGNGNREMELGTPGVQSSTLADRSSLPKIRSIRILANPFADIVPVSLLQRNAPSSERGRRADEEAESVTIPKNAIIPPNLVDDPQAACFCRSFGQTQRAPAESAAEAPVKSKRRTVDQAASSMSWRQTEVSKTEVEIPASAWGSDEELGALRKSKKTKTVCLQEELGRYAKGRGLHAEDGR
ncbi:hypothetical protein FB45DRAFT_1039132 [Roridomyces roridus]|uniref:Uncharacterized protein n=1 Tax=Roridomyces roridus TaxID=1738132 RepID=A0AAD7B2M2_9AGAR|nr:hypothetical protein FB45DRAFT_1039132 [Roridomyces roridus]